MKKLVPCVIAGALGLVACGGGGSPTAAPTTKEAVTSATPTSTQATTSTTAKVIICSAAEQHTTPNDVTTPCVPKPTTTPAPTTTTTTIDPAVAADAKMIATLATIATTQRDGMIKAIESDFPAATVEKFDAVSGVPPDRSYVTMTVDTGYQVASNQQRQLWEMIRGIAAFWASSGPLRNDAGSVHPGLVLSAHGKTYDASYDVMVAVADRHMAQDEFFAAV